jgi:HlyD family secretion protein
VLSSTNTAAKPEARQVRVGISDGVFSEVTEGLNEGDIVVIGTNTLEPSGPGAPGGPANPFGGGRRRF